METSSDHDHPIHFYYKNTDTAARRHLVNVMLWYGPWYIWGKNMYGMKYKYECLVCSSWSSVLETFSNVYWFIDVVDNDSMSLRTHALWVNIYDGPSVESCNATEMAPFHSGPPLYWYDYTYFAMFNRWITDSTTLSHLNSDIHQQFHIYPWQFYDPIGIFRRKSTFLPTEMPDLSPKPT